MNAVWPSEMLSMLRANVQALHAAWQTWRNRLAANSYTCGKYVCTEEETSLSILYFPALCGHNSKQGLPGSPVQLYE